MPCYAILEVSIFDDTPLDPVVDCSDAGTISKRTKIRTMSKAAFFWLSISYGKPVLGVIVKFGVYGVPVESMRDLNGFTKPFQHSLTLSGPCLLLCKL